MRKMSYQIEIDRDADGYFISNADTDDLWDCLPGEANEQHPPIRIKSIPYGHNEPAANLEDFVSSLEDDGYCDSEKTIYFKSREEYLSALRGESEDWKLIGIQVDDVGATLKFAYKGKRHGESLFLYPVKGKRINLLIEVDYPDGNAERYLLYLEDMDYGLMVRLTEYEPWGHREIYFKQHSHIPEHPDNTSYFYALVVEYKR